MIANETYGTGAPHPSLDPPIGKSWLFEIVDRKSGNVYESFTLVLPPSSLVIKEPQRVSIRKTFGNAFVDDYGPDNIEITIKGISGTTHAFPTFQTKINSAYNDIGGVVSLATAEAATATTGYTGKNAFYYFRDHILRYKDNPLWDQREFRAYDLADEQGYKCVLLDFTLDRNADNPLRYPFTINLFVYKRLETLKTKVSAIKLAQNPIAALNASDSLLDKIKALYRDVSSLSNQAALLAAKSTELRARYNKFLAQTTKIITSPLDLAKNFLDTASNALGVAGDTYRAGKYSLERYQQASELFLGIINKALGIYGYQISEGWQVSKTVTIENDSGVDATATDGSISRSVTLSNYEFSGLNLYTVKGDDTLQRIAQTQLGDESLWPYIAAVNSGVDTNADLVSGEVIYIPTQVLINDSTNKEQYIVSEDATRNPYGADIRLDSDGAMVIQENNDFALISGIDNVKQSVDLRLNTLTGSMMKQTAFGISGQAGIAGTTMAVRYLKIATRAALSQDPRINSVTDMFVNLAKDVVFMSMTIGVVGSEQSLPVTVIL